MLFPYQYCALEVPLSTTCPAAVVGGSYPAGALFSSPRFVDVHFVNPEEKSSEKTVLNVGGGGGVEVSGAFVGVYFPFAKPETELAGKASVHVAISSICPDHISFNPFPPKKSGCGLF